MVRTISSVTDAQLPLLTVQRNVAVVPAVIPVTVVVADEGLVIVAVPERTLHIPVPTAGTVAPIVKILVLHCSISVPATAAEGKA